MQNLPEWVLLDVGGSEMACYGFEDAKELVVQDRELSACKSRTEALEGMLEITKHEVAALQLELELAMDDLDEATTERFKLLTLVEDQESEIERLLKRPPHAAVVLAAVGGTLAGVGIGAVIVAASK